MPVSDLMAAVLPIVVIFLVATAIRAETAAGTAERAASTAKGEAKDAELARENLAKEKEAREEAEKRQREAEAARRRPIDDALETLRQKIVNEGLGDLLQIDVATHSITLPDVTFRRGSACVRAGSAKALARAAPDLLQILQSDQDVRLQVEGHSDSTQMRATRGQVRRCAEFDDNITLSAARARNARNHILRFLPPEHKEGADELGRRVLVAGWGASQPIPGVSPKDGRNRRIQISFRRAGAEGAGR